MARALRIFALLSAFFVVAVRCLSAFPALDPASAEALSGAGAVEARSSTDDARDRQAFAVADLDDDTDDATDAVIAPATVRLVQLADEHSAGVGCGALVAQRALPSHAQSLERPPRA